MSRKGEDQKKQTFCFGRNLILVVGFLFWYASYLVDKFLFVLKNKPSFPILFVFLLVLEKSFIIYRFVYNIEETRIEG